MERFITSPPGVAIALGLLLLIAVAKLGLAQVLGAEGDVRTTMSVLISIVVLGCALYMILSKRYGGEAEKWAFGSVGTIIGFWLNSGA